MNLSHLKDTEVLAKIKILVSDERQLLAQVLHHLREVEQRKLFSDLGYKSLFDYAVGELKYSAGQAGRRIQAMRLLKELPALEAKIKTGALTLTHLSQAQNYFREKLKREPQSSPHIAAKKKELLLQLENTSSRESEKIILALNPTALPPEKERMLSETHSEISFVMDDELKKALTEVRALLGPKAMNMGLSDLMKEMAQLSAQSLKAKKFGKKLSLGSTPAPELAKKMAAPAKKTQGLSRRLKFLVWQRDQGKCVKCASRSHLNFDHIHPQRLGGKHSLENLQLLCFHCNQRRGIKTFGLPAMKRRN